MSDTEELAWEPLGFVDYLILAVVGVLQAVALGVCVHLIKWRKWPPYLVKNVDIVILMASSVEGCCTQARLSVSSPVSRPQPLNGVFHRNVKSPRRVLF